MPLRDALNAKGFEITHSDSLELIAKAFGYDNWNVLSAMIKCAEPRGAAADRAHEAGRDDPTQPALLCCSFCGKNQHQVRKLVAGPTVYICDECIELCTDVVEDSDPDQELARLIQGDEAFARTLSTEELAHYVERGRKGVERNRLALDCAQRVLVAQADRADGDVPSRFATWCDKSPEELVPLQQKLRGQLTYCEDALRLATAVLNARRT